MKVKMWLSLSVMLILLLAAASVSAQSVCRDAAGGIIPCTPTPVPPPTGPGGDPGGGQPQPSADDPDGDQIVNTFDQCPNEGGPISNNGCPVGTDSDGDGTPDDRDLCPTIGGPAQNQGCQADQNAAATPVPSDSTSPTVPLPALPDDGCFVATTSGQAVNIRETASINANVIGSLNPAQTYAVDSRWLVNGETWYRLQQGGFVAGSVIRASAGCEGAPTVITTPLPADTALDLTAPEEASNVYLKIKLTDILITSYTITPGSSGVRPGLIGPTDLAVCMYHPDFGAVICGFKPDGTPNFSAIQALDPSLWGPQDLATCAYHPDFGAVICGINPDGTPVFASLQPINPSQLGPTDLATCVYHPDYGAVICGINPDGTPNFDEGQAIEPAQLGPQDLATCAYHPDFGAVICGLNPDGTPKYADGQAIDPSQLGPQDLAMCVYHPDFGAVICGINPDGTPNFDEGQAIDPSQLGPQELGMCMYHPDYGAVVCEEWVNDDNGRVGEMNIYCEIAANSCVGDIITYPDEGADCPTALILPAVQPAREAARRAHSSSASVNISELAALPQPDPCALMHYEIDLPMEQVFADFNPAAQ